MTALASSYIPAAFENDIYATWERGGYFKPSGTGAPYTILLPPPNVTGTLHMGHAFQQTLMDALIRYQRMQGRDTLWQVGSDHAGIATEMVVSRNLALENNGQTRDSLGRAGFIDKVWQWKQQSGGAIEAQMRRIGVSADWSRSVFTMDPQPAAAVTEAFVRWYQQGFIYRGKRLVNWDPVLQTAISDLEVENTEEAGSLWEIAYPLADGTCYDYIETNTHGQEIKRETRDYLIVATTRPETLLGDTAVMVHPQDGRYASLIGQEVILPITGRRVPIIGDEHVDRDFGTGVVKVTPAHDFNDYQVGLRHNLPLINIFTPTATLNENAPTAYQGLDRYAARKQIILELENQGLLKAVHPHTLQVPRGDRTGQVIEPYLTDQWFVRMDQLAQRGLELVENGSIRFVPDNWINTYRHWMENIQDWCISRQLWWGHRIPAWFDSEGNYYVARNEAEVRRTYNLSADIILHQDNDVLETWFSSQLWPFSTMGWPQPQAMIERGFERYLPSSVLVTGFDIIFFWVARMIMATDSLTGQIPFDEVYVTGLIRDNHGQKMSKSKGNVLDPLDLIDGISLEDLIKKRTTGLMNPKTAPAIEKATRKEFPQGITAFGADALRFTIAALATHGRDIKFDLNRAEGYKNFCNKLWNASRFVLMHSQEHTFFGLPNPHSEAEYWILAQLRETSARAHDYFAAYRFDLLANSLYDFVWNDFCDWFLELSKVTLQETDSPAANSIRHTLIYVLEAILRLLHPLIPFVTEKLWQSLILHLDCDVNTVCLRPYPHPDQINIVNTDAQEDIAWLQTVVTAIRRIRSELNVPPSKTITLLLQHGQESDYKRLSNLNGTLAFLLKLEAIHTLEENSALPPAATAVVGTLKLLVPLQGLIDITAERSRLDKEISRLENEASKSQTKLARFNDKVPPAVIIQEKQRLAHWQTQLATLRQQRDAL